MIYTKYEAVFFYDRLKNTFPVKDYLDSLQDKQRIKVLKYIEFLTEHEGYLDEPYSKHIKGKIRELRVDFGKNRHRIFFFTHLGHKIILVHAFLKKTSKTPISEIAKAEASYLQILNDKKLYE